MKHVIATIITAAIILTSVNCFADDVDLDGKVLVFKDPNDETRTRKIYITDTTADDQSETNKTHFKGKFDFQIKYVDNGTWVDYLVKGQVEGWYQTTAVAGKQKIYMIGSGSEYDPINRKPKYKFTLPRMVQNCYLDGGDDDTANRDAGHGRATLVSLDKDVAPGPIAVLTVGDFEGSSTAPEATYSIE